MTRRVHRWLAAGGVIASVALGGCSVLPSGTAFVEVIEEHTDTLGRFSDHGKPYDPAVLEGYMYDAPRQRLYPCAGHPADAQNFAQASLVLGHVIHYDGTSDENFFRRLLVSARPQLEEDLRQAVSYRRAPGGNFGPHEALRFVESLRLHRERGEALAVQYGDQARTLHPGDAWELPEVTRTYTPEDLLKELRRIEPDFVAPDGYLSSAPRLTTRVTIRYHGLVQPVPLDLLELFQRATRDAIARRFDDARRALDEFLAALPEHAAARALRESLTAQQAQAGPQSTVRGHITFPALTAEQQARLDALRRQFGAGWMLARAPDDPNDAAWTATELEGENYTVVVPAGTYALVLRATGFRPMTRRITLTAGAAQEDFALTAEDWLP